MTVKHGCLAGILIQFSICGELDQTCLIQKINYKPTLKVSFFSILSIYASKCVSVFLNFDQGFCGNFTNIIMNFAVVLGVFAADFLRLRAMASFFIIFL